MHDPFDASLLGRGPVYLKGLRAGPNDHADKLLGIACGELNRFVEHLDVAVFIDFPDHPDLSATEWQRVGHTERRGQRAPRASQARVLPLTDQPACEIGVVGHLKGVRPRSQVPQGTEAIPLPDLLLPEAVVAFDLGIGGGLPLGRKDRDDSIGQARR